MILDNVKLLDLRLDHTITVVVVPVVYINQMSSTCYQGPAWKLLSLSDPIALSYTGQSAMAPRTDHSSAILMIGSNGSQSRRTHTYKVNTARS